MTIRGMIFLSALFMLAVGVLVISQSVGSAIESKAYVQRRGELQRQEQQHAGWVLEHEIKEQTKDETIALREWSLKTLTYLVPILLTLIAAQTMYTYRGYTNAKVKEAKFKATMVHLDPETRTYPLLTFVGSNGRLMLHDPNSKHTANVLRESDAQPLLVSHSTAVQLQSMIKDSRTIVNVPALMDLES